MRGRVSKIFAVLLLGTVLLGLFGVGLQSGPQCSVFGCPLNAGVFAAVGAQAAQSVFVIAVMLFGLLAVQLSMTGEPAFLSGHRVFAEDVRPSGASKRKLEFWRSLRETSPTAA